MASFSSRLRAAREHAELTQDDLAAACKVSRASVSQWENGATTPRGPKAEMAAKTLGTTAAWLLHGVGAAPVHTASPALSEPQTGFQYPLATLTEVDVRASAGAGAVVDYENDAHTWGFPEYWLRAELSARPAELRIITIEGDSMLSDPPRRDDLEPGDKVIVNIADRSPTPPGIFIVHDGLGLVAKRVHYLPDSDPPAIRITSNNERYPDYERSLDEAHVLGRIVGRWQRF